MGQESPSSRRRDVLRAGAGAVALSTLGATVAANTDDDVDAAYAPQGQVDIEGAAEAVVTPDGQTAFVAVGSGFVSVDVSDPANPSIVATRAGLQSPDGTAVQEVLDVKYDDGRLLVPTAAQRGGPKGFYLFDVSDPANPEQVGDWYESGHGNHNSFLHEGYAYLTGGLIVDIVDVSGDTFEQVATWEPGDWNEDWAQPTNTVLHDLYVQGEYAYCAYWDGGTFILDVSDPANPSFVSRVGDYTLEELNELSRQAYLEPGGNDHYVTVNEDATLMAEGGESWDLESEDDSGGPSGITLFDISDKANPEELGHIDAPVSPSNAYRGGTWTTSHNFDIQGGRLYASWYQGGVSVHDISDPASPERVAWWSSPDERAFWTAQLAVEDEFFVASSHGVNGVTPGLVTFPDTSGEMSEPPETVAWSRDDLPGEATTTTTTSGGDGETTDDSGETTSGGDGETTDDGGETTSDDDGETTDDGGETTSGGDGEMTDGGGESTSGDGEETTTESGGSPGFGVLTAIGGLGVGAARFLRGRGE